ncbi:MAG: phosphoribosylformylglycinamidine cyclo-ligase [Planctomycetes bacterium]|nr:phosphoribosylformylglycinamidine cyclo-ligase [Planctomycetota bacterium]
MPITYIDAGVDQTKKDQAVESILKAARRTHGPGVIDIPWGFAGLYSLKSSPLFDRSYRHPLLVACTDGVGTKLKIAQAMGRHDTVGIDCVAMSVNDLIVTGGRPLFFLDYIGCGKADPDLLRALVRGLVDGCLESECALLGGETAEMPGIYAAGDYDLVGFAVGVVEKSRLVDGSAVKAGDDVIGLASSGIHSNGASLARKILFEVHGKDVRESVPELGGTLGDTLLAPTRIYARAIKEVLRRYKVKKAVKAIAHITGGGMIENIPRVLPAGCAVELREGAWPVPPIFPYLARLGEVPRDEMFRVFNMGVGLVLIVSPASTGAILRTLRRRGEKAWVIGKVIRGAQEVRILPP